MTVPLSKVTVLILDDNPLVLKLGRALLEREGRTELAQAAFRFLPSRARLDLAGWPEIDIFEH